MNSIKASKFEAYNVELKTHEGCDSTAILILVKNLPTSSITKTIVCEGDSIIFNNIYLHQSGIYSAHYININGCDSTATLELNVKQSTNSITNGTICENETYLFNGHIFTNAGRYRVILTNSVGCDSIANLYLTVKKTSESHTSASICFGNNFNFNNTLYTSSGTFIHHFINTEGCDSSAILHLNVKEQSKSNTDIIICEGGSYSFNDSIYNKAGIYSFKLYTDEGCDSTAILNLSISNPQPEIIGSNKLCINSFSQSYYVVNRTQDSKIYWYIDSVVQNSTQNSQQALLDFTKPGIFTVQAKEESFGCIGIDTIKVFVSDIPKADFSYSTHPITFITDFYNETNEIILYDDTSNYVLENFFTWDIASYGNQFIQTSKDSTNIIQHQFKFGKYPVTLWVTNSFGCKDSITKNLEFDLITTLYTPNAFAPNNGAMGVREFKPKGVNIETYKIWIFDQWGNFLWYSDKVNTLGMPTEGWNGKYNGELLQSGTYFWKIEATYLNGDYKNMFGSVFLIR